MAFVKNQKSTKPRAVRPQQFKGLGMEEIYNKELLQQERVHA